jgi:hypothetical protein
VRNFAQTPAVYGRNLLGEVTISKGRGATERCHARLATLPHERGRVPAGGQDMSATISRSHSRCCHLTRFLSHAGDSLGLRRVGLEVNLAK